MTIAGINVTVQMAASEAAAHAIKELQRSIGAILNNDTAEIIKAAFICAGGAGLRYSREGVV